MSPFDSLAKEVWVSACWSRDISRNSTPRLLASSFNSCLRDSDRMFPIVSLLLFCVLLQQQAGIVTTKTEGIGHSRTNRLGLSLVRYIVEIKTIIRRLVVDRRRQHIVLDCQCRSDALCTTSSAQQMSRHGLDGGNGDVFGCIAPDCLDSFRLTLIIHVRGCTMCIDIVYISSLHAGIVKSQLHASCLELAMRSRARDVIGIRVCAVADNFGIDMRAAGFGMIEAFDDNEASAFTHDEAAAILVKWTGCMLRIIIVVHAECLHRTETSYSRLRNRSFRTTGYHDIGIAALDDTECITNAVGARCTSRNHAGRRTMQFIRDGNLAGSHVGNHHRHKERADTSWSFGKEFLILAMHRLDTADTRTNERTDAIQVLFLKIQFSIFDGQIRSSYSKLCATIHTLGFFLIDVI